MSDFAKDDFRDLKISNVEFVYPHVDHLVHYKPSENKTVECDEHAHNANWETSFTLEESRAKKLYALAEKHFKDRCGKKEPFGAIHGYNETMYNDQLQMRFKAAVKAKTAKGKLNNPPIVVDPDGQPVENRKFWTGSTGDITFTMFPADNPKTGKKGISFILKKIVLHNAVYPSDDDVEQLDDYENPTDVQDKQDYHDLDDEVPF